MKVGKTYHFDAAHYIPGHEKCGLMHGHTWRVTVTAQGFVDGSGILLDFHTLDEKVKSVLSKLDHRCLNEVMDVPPTCENVGWLIYYDLLREIPNLSSVRVQEGEGGWAENE